MSAQLLRVFVYGTLKRGEPNHYWLTTAANGSARFVEQGKTIDKFPLVVGTRYNIPFLLDKRGEGHHVQGEIYEVDQRMFRKLDELEGYPGYYDREIQQIKTESDGTIDCWLYLIRKFPDNMLKKSFLESYTNSKEQPYCESYLESIISDMNESDGEPK